MSSLTRSVLLTPGLAGTDGIAEVSRQFTRALGEWQAPVVVHALHDAPDGAAIPGSTVRGAASRRSRFAAGVLAQSLARGLQAGYVLHLHLAPVAIPLAWRRPVAVVLHGVEAWAPLSPLQAYALRCARALIAVSNASAARFVAGNPAFAGRSITVCHPACPPAVAAAAPELPPGFALIVGRMNAAERYKGHDVLIEAWPSVMRRHPGARLIVAGDGDDRPRLERRVAEAGLGGAVRFLGTISAAQLAALYRDAAFLVMPSTGEGFGLVYLEAMRAGLPCIAAPGAAEEIVIDGETGLIVSPDAATVAAAVDALLADGHRRRDMGARGAARVDAEFAFPKFAARLAAVMERLPTC
jgi:phosphatidylinositol alpha-1,6-mannosyltransferase